MPQSLYKMLVHIVFSTKNRADLIAPEIEDGLYAYIHGIVENNGAKLIVGGGTSNHIHLLVSLPKKIDVPVLIGGIKRDSSVWIKEQSTKYADFYWQKGYGAFSIGQTQIGKISNYIKTQKEHHQKHTFESEYRTWLNEYKIDFDENYVWD